MDIICPCLRKVFRPFWGNRTAPPRKLTKRYSDFDNSVGEISSPSDTSDSSHRNFVQEQGKTVFIKPDIDSDTDSVTVPNNLLINKCRNGRYVILNALENAYIDDCEDTFIFLGPCHSTLFIRNCRNIKIRVISQQLRIQNSENIEVEGIVGVRPVLESSKAINFHSLSIHIYDDLIWQIQCAKINPLDNQIYECYDFTPSKPPNYHNQPITTEMDPSWEEKLKQSNLNWQEQNPVRLPTRLPMKRSMMKKLFTEKYLQSNGDIFVLYYQETSLKEMLLKLNKKNLYENIQLITYLKEKTCLEHLEEKQQFGVLKKKVSERWVFLLIKVADEQCLQILQGKGFYLIRNPNIISQLVNKI